MSPDPHVALRVAQQLAQQVVPGLARADQQRAPAVARAAADRW
jgi:hypothetical protein